ncbi:MAG: glycoside hydrolase family 20 zincin-like fold domain-containing protein [Anaerolineae bacterium]
MSDLHFIPEPSLIERRHGAFPLTAATRILVAPDASPQTSFAAADLAGAINRITGLMPGIVAVFPNADSGNAIRLALGSTGQGPEGYLLEIGAAGAVITAEGEAGLFYGVQTLIQALKTKGRVLPALRIEDKPALPNRGLMLDISRGRVPRLDFLKRLAAFLAHYKFNQFQLYTEHTFAFSRHADFAESVGALTGAEMRELDAYCRERHLELVPNLQSYGHHRSLLSLDQYKHLSETSWPWSLTPANEETYRLLDEWYGEMLPNFTSMTLNVDCDETIDHGLGQSAAAAAERGKGRLYLDHILRLRELAAKYGRRIQVWADIINEYPDLIPEIPDDVTLLDWWYESQPTYPTIDAIAKAGRRFMACPGTSSWNSVFPRVDNALGNIRGYTRAGIAAGTNGMLLTDWGDYGHYQQPAGSVYLYAFGAETAWTGGATEPEEFDRKAGPLVFDDLSGRVVAAIRGLGKAVSHPAIRAHGRSDAAYAIFDDPLAGRTADMPADVVKGLAEAAVEALPVFAALHDEEMRHELSFAAYQTAFGAAKVALTQEIRAALQDGRDVTPLVSRLKTQRDALAAMRAEFEQLWLAVSKRAEIDLSLSYFDTALAHQDAAIAWLASGQRDLSTYQMAEQALLWEVGFKELMQLVQLVGLENLPPIVQAWLGQAPAGLSKVD